MPCCKWIWRGNQTGALSLFGSAEPVLFEAKRDERGRCIMTETGYEAA